MFNSIGNFNNAISNAIHLLGANHEDSAATRLVSNNQLRPTIEHIEELLKPLDHANWAQMRANLIQNQPNLAVAFSMIDAICPKDETQSVSIAGLEAQGPHLNQYHQPPQLRVSKIENMPSDQKNKINSWGGFLLGENQRLKGLNQFNRLSSQKNKQLPEATGYLEDRHKAIQVLLSHLLVGKKGIKGHFFLTRNEKGIIDLHPEAIRLIADTLLDNDTKYRKTDLNSLLQVLAEIDHQTDSDNKEKILGSGLTKAESKVFLKLDPTLIHLVSVIDQFLCLRNDVFSDGDESFPIFSDDQFPYFLSECRKNNQLYAPTFIDQVKRFANPNHTGSGTNNKNKASSWLSNLSGHQIPYEHEGELIYAIVQQAEAQLSAGGEQDRFFKRGSLLPLVIYQLVGQIIDKPLPSFLLDFERQTVDHLSQLKQVNDLKLKQETERIKASRKLEKEEKQRSQQKLEQTARQLGVQPNFDQIMKVERGSSTALETKTFDMQFGLTQSLDAEIEQLLIDSHVNVDVSSKNRSQTAIDHINSGLSPALYTDNLCWLRASWLSVFEHFESPDHLARAIDEANIGFYFPDKKNYAEPFILGTKKIMMAYQKDRLNFLHLGEENQFLEKPAHFRCGQSVAECLNEFGIDGKLSTFDKPKIDYRQYSTESFLKEVLTRLSSGIRSTVPELVFLDQPSMMASSDIPTALYRALNLPLVLIENHQNQVSIRLAGPKNHLIHEASKRLSANNQTEISPLDAKTLFALANDIPIIYLQSQAANDGHYTVFLPKDRLLISEMMKAQHAKNELLNQERKVAIEVKRPDVVEIFYDTSNKQIFPMKEHSCLLMASPATKKEVKELLQLAKEQYPKKPLIIELNESNVSKLKPKTLPIKSLISINNLFKQAALRVTSESSLSISSKRSASLSTIEYKENQLKHKVELLQLPFRKTEITRVLANDFLDALQAMHQLAPNNGYIVVSPKGSTPAALFTALDEYIRHTMSQPKLAEVKNQPFNQNLLDFVISEGPVHKGKPILAETKIKEVLEQACTAYHAQQNQIEKAVYA